MEVVLSINENNTDPNIDEENYNALIKQIYKKFPEAIWEKENKGFKIFI